MSEQLEAELLETALVVATACASHVRNRRAELFDGTTQPTTEFVQSKSSDTDPVTVVDTETEELARTLLRARRPDDRIVGEEQGGGVDDAAGMRWLVDPIDGTVNFLYGIPGYAVSVAAQRDGQTLAGCVCDVAANVAYFAAKGGGAFARIGGRDFRLQASTADQIGHALVATGFGYASDRRAAQGATVAALLPKVRDIRRFGAAALDLCFLAQGRVDAYYERGLSGWDWAAGALIAQEAGAVVGLPPATASGDDGALLWACAPGLAGRFPALLAQVEVTE